MIKNKVQHIKNSSHLTTLVIILFRLFLKELYFLLCTKNKHQENDMETQRKVSNHLLVKKEISQLPVL